MIPVATSADVKEDDESVPYSRHNTMTTTTSDLSLELKEEEEDMDISRFSSPNKTIHVSDMQYTQKRAATVEVSPMFGGMLNRQGYWFDWSRRYLELSNNTLFKGVRRGGAFLLHVLH
jgi:hypothetical protein